MCIRDRNCMVAVCSKYPSTEFTLHQVTLGPRCRSPHVEFVVIREVNNQRSSMAKGRVMRASAPARRTAPVVTRSLLRVTLCIALLGRCGAALLNHLPPGVSRPRGVVARGSGQLCAQQRSRLHLVRSCVAEAVSYTHLTLPTIPLV